MQPDRLDRRKFFTILVVDDEPSILRAVTRLLGVENYNFVVAEDGAAALELYKQGGIDLVISDRQMPGMGGLELLKKLKEHDPEAKVIILSGGIGEKETAEFHRYGALNVLEKPIAVDVLKKAVLDALAGNGAMNQKSASILLVDDDEDTRYAMSEILCCEGNKVVEAENGLDALGTFMAGRFDIVISDLHMPAMDGLEMLIEMKKARPNAKVIMVSGEAREQEIQALRDAGAFEILKKPVEPRELEAAIERALRS
jgi:DNA-binding NtrC family response regulator